MATYDYHDFNGSLLFQAIRYNPKNFRQRRPDGKGDWIWNLKDVTPVLFHLPQLLKADRDLPVFVVEGEEDVLSLEGLGLVATTNPMGAGKWRDGYSEWLQDRQVVIIPDDDPPDPRNHGIGKGLSHAYTAARSLLNLAATVKLLRLTDRGQKEDVSDWLKAGGSPDTLLRMAKDAPLYIGVSPGEDEEGNPEHLNESSGTPVWEGSKWRAPARRIIQKGLLENGYFIKAAGRFYYFDRETKFLLELGTFDMELLLNERFSVNPTEALYNYLRAELQHEAAARGVNASVQYFTFYDKLNNVMYMDLGNGRMLHMDGKEITERDNGTDGVLFAPKTEQEPWEYQPGAPPDQLNNMLIEPMNFAAGDGPHTPDEQGVLMLLWLLAISFGSILPTKPLALAVGPAGSGKSSFFRRIGKLMMGNTWDVNYLGKDDEEKFWVGVTNRRFICLDNVDRHIPWLNDALATLATGVQITKRVLHTTNTEATYTPMAFLALTARTPRFRREDVAERLVIFQLDSLKEKRAEDELLTELMDNRDALLSDYANMLNQIVATNTWPQVDPSIRLADFAKVAARIGAGLGIPDVAADVLSKMRLSQSIYATEENSLFLVLDQWITQMAPSRPDEMMTVAEFNAGRKVHTKDLYAELKSVATDEGLPWHWKNAIALGKQIKALEPALSVQFSIQYGQDAKSSWWRFNRLTIPGMPEDGNDEIQF